MKRLALRSLTGAPFVGALATLAFAGSIAAQGPIQMTDRNATFVYSAYPSATNSTAGAASFNTAFANMVAASWWYYRVSSDTTGSAFNSNGGQFTATVSADRRTGTCEWANVDSRNFAARLVNCVYSTGPFTGISAQSMTITNNTGAPLTITVYSYADIDLDISTDDSAFQMAGEAVGQTRVTDPTNQSVYFMADNYSGWEAAVWPTLRDNILNTAHTLANATLPLTNQDYSGAFSWTMTIQPGASQRMNSLLSIERVPASRNVASAVPFGAAKAGTPGLSEWTPNRPFAGTSASLQITNGLAGSAPIVFIGTTTANLPVPPFGTVYVLPAATFNMPAFSATGVSTLSLNVPPVSAGVLHFQGLWGDAGAPGGVAHTSGLTWTLGSF